jgi:hypothetical protein
VNPVSDESKKVIQGRGFLSLPILRDVLIVLLIGIASWKLLNSDTNVDFSAFAFSDLLALILALFSVWLSVAFYFKATETSNQFYDNSYKFTKEMSEILGRIEAGFGEKLRHLDEGYTGIRDKFDRLPHYVGATTTDVEKEEEEVKKREREQHALLEDLARRANLADAEKQHIFAQLAEKNEELEQARMELRHLRTSQDISSHTERERIRPLISYIADRIKEATPPDLDQRSPTVSIIRIFRKIKEEIHSDAILDLERFGLLDSGGDLTRKAVILIREEMKRN